MHIYLFFFSLMSTKSTIKGKLEYVFSGGTLGPCLWFSFWTGLTTLTFLCSDSGDEYVDSLNSVHSGTAYGRKTKVCVHINHYYIYLAHY